MNALEIAVNQALHSPDNTSVANKAYLEFIKANFFIPIENISTPEEPVVLFYMENNQTFLPVFSNRTFLQNWACSINNEIKLLTLSGVDLLKGIGEDVMVCLNIGTTDYKEFNPAELARMRSMVLKLFQ